MRFLVFCLFFVALSHNSLAQLPSKLKYDQLLYSYDSTTVLIQKGSWNSVYNLKTKSFQIAPTKSVLINFPKSNFYAEIQEKTGNGIIHYTDEKGFQKIFANGDSCTLGISPQQNGTTYYDINGNYFDKKMNDDSLYMINKTLNWNRFELIKYSENTYILNHYFDGLMRDAYHFRDETGATIMDGYYLTNPYSSGVYNLAINKWIVEPTYKRCYAVKNHVFALKEIFVKGNSVLDVYQPNRFDYSYDLFKIENDNAELAVQDFSEINSDLLLPVLNLDELELLDENGYYRTEKDGEIGFMKFQLFNSNFPKAEFVCAEILAPDFDAVFYDSYLSKIITVERGDNQLVSLYHLRHSEFVDDKYSSLVELIICDSNKVGFGIDNPTGIENITFVVDSKIHLLFEINYPRGHTLEISESNLRDVNNSKAGFQIELINDSLLVVQDFSSDVFSDYPVKSILYPGEDSVDENYYTVYEISNLGKEKSGVYNLNSKRWQIEPIAKSIAETGTGFLIEYANRSNDLELFENVLYSFVDFAGNEIFSRISADALLSNLDLLKYCVPETSADSLFEAPSGSWHHTLMRDRYIPSYYAVSDDGLAWFEPYEYYGVYLLSSYVSSKEFLHVNSEKGFKFWLSGDSIFVEVDSIKKAVYKNHGKIHLVKRNFQLEDGNYGCFDILQINGGDTIKFSTIPELDAYYTSFVASIEVNDDILIVNDLSRSDISCIECMDSRGNWYNTYGSIETENSSVWKNVNGKWKKMSPYYAAISAIPNGYIARTGLFEETYDYYGGPNTDYAPASIGRIESRYFFLDSNLRVVPYLDYFDFHLIEDLGFGLKVAYDNSGCFFMTYNRVGVTDAVWDDFELYNKKLKAITNEVQALDEYGEPVFDEYGAPVMISESVIMFFKIP